MGHEEDTALRAGLGARTEELASKTVDAAFSVHSELGPGLLESIYKRCLAHELSRRGIAFQRQVSLPIQHKDLRIDSDLRLDLVIDDRVVVELKAVDAILPVHRAQVITFLKLTKIRLGFLINFNVPVIKSGIERFVM